MPAIVPNIEKPVEVIHADRDQLRRGLLSTGGWSVAMATKNVAALPDTDGALQMLARHRRAYHQCVSVGGILLPEGMKTWTGGDCAPADWDGGLCWQREGGLVHPQDIERPWNDDQLPGDIIAYTPAQTREAELQAEIERLRALLISPGDPAWEDARGVLVAELRKAGMGTHADNVAVSHAVLIPSWIALNLIAHARMATIASESEAQP